MGAGHGHRLHYHGHSWLHRARPEHKILALLGLMVLVVGTPESWIPAYAGFLLMLVGAALSARVPLGYLARRMAIGIPVAVFALALPWLVPGPRVEIAGLSLSEAGLTDASVLLARATTGLLAGLLLAATTEPRELVVGLERLRLPRVMVQIVAFMIRYVDVVTAEMTRMRIARESRGFSARTPAHWPVLAKSVGALFIRSYERGERVHLAMLSRGYRGELS
jgi:cobalt/nickel transport system permease protein